jgi:C4-dicarboxylate-specific signal transduction histidine kinase
LHNLWDGEPSLFSIALSHPIYNNQGQPIGAIGIDLLLSNISHFLQKLKQHSPGQVLIIERDGMIIGSSTSEEPFVEINGEKQRLNITESHDGLTRMTAKALLSQFKSFDRITQNQLFHFTFENDRQFATVTPWQDKYGLN